MDIYYGFNDIGEYDNVVVALGNFDGVHLGHRKLVETTIDLARQFKGTSAVLTFDPHPMSILQPELCPPMLLAKEDKIRIMSELGIELLLITPFCADIAQLTPERFVKEILVDKLKVRGIVAGYNFTFGCNGRGNPEVLSSLAEQYDIRVVVVPPVTHAGVEVSSTLIRGLLMQGQVAHAAEYLGYSPFVRSKVVYGDQRGRQIGFPTANLNLSTEVLAPANGVYAVKVYVEEECFNGVANVGLRPTFKLDQPRNLEVNIFDFYGDLYGKNIKVEFVERIRGERKFSSIEGLKNQIQEDIKAARKALNIQTE